MTLSNGHFMNNTRDNYSFLDTHNSRMELEWVKLFSFNRSDRRRITLTAHLVHLFDGIYSFFPITMDTFYEMHFSIEKYYVNLTRKAGILASNNEPRATDNQVFLPNRCKNAVFVISCILCMCNGLAVIN